MGVLDCQNGKIAEKNSSDPKAANAREWESALGRTHYEGL
jgi:hypothetical protein